MKTKEMKHTLSGSAMFLGFELHRKEWAKKREANTERFFSKIYESEAYQNYLDWNYNRINKQLEKAQDRFEKTVSAIEI